MNKEEYNLNLNALVVDFNLKKRRLIKDYALANNPYKKGDIITDHVATIEIEKISVYVGSSSDIQCCYDGTQLNKDGTINKKQNHTCIYQCNIIPNENI